MELKGLRKLVEFCLCTRALLLFTSTIGVLQACPGGIKPVKEGPVPPEYAISNGYTQSKWVAEKILDIAHTKAQLTYVSIRVGQLTGGVNGVWNSKEWIPNMIQSSTRIGYIPGDSKNVSWIPIYYAAAILVEILDYAPEEGQHYVHLVHPHPVTWSSLVDVISRDCGLKVIPYNEWISRLEKTGGPDNHLMSFFQAMNKVSGDNKEAFGLPMVESNWILKKQRPDIKAIGEADVKMWLNYWKGL